MSEIVKIYQYRDLAGAVVSETVRYKPKDFRQRRPDGKGGYIWSITGIETMLYRLPEITRAIKNQTPIWLCEGEKDADNLAALGLESTTAPMGAGKWQDGYTTSLAGARLLILWDKDEAGVKHAAAISDDLYFETEMIKFVNIPAPHKDVSKWIEAGGTREQLIAMADEAEIFMPYWLQNEYLQIYRHYTVAEIEAEIKYLQTAPLRCAQRAKLITMALEFKKEAYEINEHHNKYIKALIN